MAININGRMEKCFKTEVAHMFPTESNWFPCVLIYICCKIILVLGICLDMLTCLWLAGYALFVGATFADPIHCLWKTRGPKFSPYFQRVGNCWRL